MILLNFDTAIKGDSTLDSHTDWITIDGIEFGVGREITSSGGGTDRETSNPAFSQISLSKSMDKASVDLMMQAACGVSLGKATIHFIQTAGADAKTEAYLEIVLSDAIISSYGGNSSGERPSETMSISFTAFQMTYNYLDKGGTLKKGESKGFDLKTNKPL